MARDRMLVSPVCVLTVISAFAVCNVAGDVKDKEAIGA